MLNDCKTRLWIPPSELHLAKSKSNATSLAKLASCTAILWTVDCKSANRYEFEANSMSNSWRFARAQAQGYNLCPACRIMAGWQGDRVATLLFGGPHEYSFHQAAPQLALPRNRALPASAAVHYLVSPEGSP